MKRPRLASLAFALSVLALGSFATAASPAEKEAEEYMQTWEERGREACKDNERGCAAAGHALDRAAAAYEKAGRLDKAMAIRKMILDPQWHLDYTDYGRAAMFKLARNHQSLTEYAEAAQLIETAVRRFAKSDEAPDALEDAFLFRLALGEFDRAKENIELFSKNYGGKRPADAAKLMYALSSTFWEQNRPKDALTSLEKQMAFIDRNADVQYRALAHALLGRIHARDGATAKAAAEFGIVRAFWERPDAAFKQLNALGGTDEEQMRRLGQVLTVVGEATFFFAEQKRAEADAIRFPEYQGPGDKDSVYRFIATKVKDWLTTKRSAVEAAESAYRKVLDLQPVPPPRWVVPSAARVGLLWSTFTTDFQRAPTPKEWESSKPVAGSTLTGKDLKRLYLDNVSSAVEPYMERAKASFKVCVDYSMKYQYADENSRACVAWLEKNYRKQWIPVVEFMPAPRHTATPIVTSLILPNP